MMKPTSQARKRASAILLTMLTAAAMPSGQSGQERKDEALRYERRGMIATSGKNRQDNIKARREYVGMHEKHPFNKSVPATKTPLEAESGQLANREKANGEGRRDVMNQKIDEDGGEEEPRRAAMELTIPGNEAGGQGGDGKRSERIEAQNVDSERAAEALNRMREHPERRRAAISRTAAEGSPEGQGEHVAGWPASGSRKVASKPSVPVSGEEPPRLPRNGGTSYSAFRSGSRR